MSYDSVFDDEIVVGCCRMSCVWHDMSGAEMFYVHISNNVPWKTYVIYGNEVPVSRIPIQVQN
jgi:hypothetical protein